MNQDLFQKLAVAKKIMDKQNEMPRGNSPMSISSPSVQSFEPINANYNIPQEFLQEQKQVPQQNSNVPMSQKIQNSKLPDEIKRLMLEHPIEQPQTQPVLSNEVVEAATRLMKTDAAGNIKGEPKKIQSNFDYSTLKSMLKETIEEVLTEKGLLYEESSSTKQGLTFRVGSHVFEGVVTKIKKVK
jgi:hypothetical protein